MKTRPLFIILAIAVLMTVSACAGYKERTLDYLGKRPTTGPFFQEDTKPMVEINYEAGKKIADQLEERLPPGSPITVSMFRMRGSSIKTDFAKVVTEQVASRIAQEGYAIVADSSNFPMKAIDDDFAPPVKCILAGAYSVGPEQIFVTAAVSTVNDGEILGSWDWTVPLNSKTRALLPIKEDPHITPMVNTSGPFEKQQTEGSSYQHDFIPEDSGSAPGFEENILQ